MAISGLVLGIINIAIVVVLLLLLGAVAVWLLQWIAHVTIPGQVQQLFLIFVALVALYMIAALIFGLPSISVLR
jgi:predicted ABC-type exoprotein transport system permease subunit